MARTNRYSPEVRERAVRKVVEHFDDFSSEWAAITSVSSKLGMTPETLRVWVRRAQDDGGLRPGLTTDERKRLKELEKENRDLRRANEMADSTGRRNELGELLRWCHIAGNVKSIWPHRAHQIWPHPVWATTSSLMG